MVDFLMVNEGRYTIHGYYGNEAGGFVFMMFFLQTSFGILERSNSFDSFHLLILLAAFAAETLL